MTPGPGHDRWRGAGQPSPWRAVAVATLVAAVLCVQPAAWARQASPGGPPAGHERTPQPGSEEAEDVTAAPVLLGGEPVIWVFTGLGPYTPQVRAARITRRLESVVHDRTILDPRVAIVESADSSELRVQQRLLMVVTARDAQVLGAARQLVAAEHARAFEGAIRAERLRYAPATLIRSGIYGGLATVVLGVGVWLILRLTRWTHRRVERWRLRWLESLRVQHAELIPAERLTRLIGRASSAVRVVLVLLAINIYQTFVLGLFPWTRAVSLRLLDYLLAPVRAITAAFIGYLPNLLFVVAIAIVIYVANRLVAAFFAVVQQGRVVFPGFPAEWAEPTNKIVRVLLVAFGLVVAFPYLPASDSPAFTGVSVFMGVLISLASSSALANAIAGLVLMYTGAFRLGDRVRVGESFGDILETSMLATRLRTIKNEEITIPNAIVLTTAVTNYSREAATRGLILHTSVTIGYDAPWRQVHALLVEAALGTRGVLREPAPFVLQTALNDFYVAYEINAYTRDAQDMIDIYAALHERIQDAFFAAGVEIMSPHYTSVRDGNTIAVPPPYRAPGYEPGRFRVEQNLVSPAAAGDPAPAATPAPVAAGSQQAPA